MTTQYAEDHEEQRAKPYTRAGSSAVESNSPRNQAEVITTAPGQLRVIKRNGAVVHYDENNISVAITKAFLANEGGSAAASSRIHEKVKALTDQISNTFKRRMPSGGTIHIEEIQDQVELVLMRNEEHRIARAYVLYREDHARQRAEKASELLDAVQPSVNIVNNEGELEPLDVRHLEDIIQRACQGLTDIEPAHILRETLKNLYDGVSVHEINTSMLITARTLIEQEPDYSYVAARLLLEKLKTETFKFLNIKQEQLTSPESGYRSTLPLYIEKGIALELLSSDLGRFDLNQLADAIVPERDLQFNYLGLQTLYDRYFIHSKEIRFELPQIFFMRVAMGLAIQEQEKEARAIEFYHLLSSFDFMSSTPTLFNAGTQRPQLSSCYLTTVSDDLKNIFGAIQDNAMLSKWAGGLGNDWTNVRALGAYIKGTNGKSQGVIPFLKIANDTAVAVNQGGKRKGAVCAYLETWHLDIEEFLELRKNTGDDRRRTHDMNTCNWIPDLFMKRLFKEQDWTLFSPSDVPDLHDLYGAEFEMRYAEYERMTETGDIKLFKKMPALTLWRKMLSMVFETGHPWIAFKDACNLRSPQQHVGVVHSSNLCTEITLNTSADEIAVCNLGSINLVNHVDENGLNEEKLKATIKTAIRMLDNVIDINYYAVPEARRANLRHRPIGLGIMGYQDVLYTQNIPYSSDAAVQFADECMETISYWAIDASVDLAVERGAYSTFEGSLWSKGILPIDSITNLKENRSGNNSESLFDLDLTHKLDWGPLRDRVKTNGVRNSNIMAIAPTATIANITGVSQSIEPTYQNLYVKSNLSGEFTVVNPHLVRMLKQRNLWDNVMVNDLKYYDGSVQKIDRIPEDIKAIFRTAFEVEPRWLVDAAARRQKWIDQSQSLNLYMAEASGKKLDITYRMAWLRGLKTTYYLRTMGATSTEKSTINSGTLNAVNADGETFNESMVCSIDDPTCEACQ